MFLYRVCSSAMLCPPLLVPVLLLLTLVLQAPLLVTVRLGSLLGHPGTLGYPLPLPGLRQWLLQECGRRWACTLAELSRSSACRASVQFLLPMHVIWGSFGGGADEMMSPSQPLLLRVGDAQG